MKSFEKKRWSRRLCNFFFQYKTTDAERLVCKVGANIFLYFTLDITQSILLMLVALNIRSLEYYLK